MLKKKFLPQNSVKNGPEASSRPFLISKESSVKGNLRRSAYWFGQISVALLSYI